MNREQIMKLQTYKMFEEEDTVYVERDDVLKLLEQEQQPTWVVGANGAEVAFKDVPVDKAVQICAIIGEEQQTSEDCISREWAIYIASGYCHPANIADELRKLPSVTPKGVTVTDFADKCKECGKIQKKLSEDVVSRQEVIDIINFEDKWLFDANGHNANTKIALSGLKSRVKALPSVTPQRPKGTWICIEDNPDEYHYECSECGHHMNWIDESDRYCPSCGCQMDGDKEDSDGS